MGWGLSKFSPTSRRPRLEPSTRPRAHWLPTLVLYSRAEPRGKWDTVTRYKVQTNNNVTTNELLIHIYGVQRVGSQIESIFKRDEDIDAGRTGGMKCERRVGRVLNLTVMWSSLLCW